MQSQQRSPHPPKTTRTAEIRKQTATVQRQIQRDQEKAKVEDQDDGVVYTATGTTISSSQQTFTAAAFASAHKKKLQQQQQQTATTANGTVNNNNNKNASSARSIGHSGTSQSASALAAETSQQLASFEAVFALMSNPSTAEQFDRHASQLSALLPQLLPRSSIPAKLADPSSSHGGLPAIIKQVAHAVATNEAAAGLGGSLAQLLELASFPIQCSTLHDQRALPVCVVALLEAVSTSLFEPHTLAIRTQAATVMRDIIRRVNERCGVDIRSSTNLSTIGKSGTTIKSKNAAEIASNAAVTTTSSTGSTVQELRGAVTKQSVLALAEAWSSAIDREYNAAIDFAKSSAAQNTNNANNSNKAISGDDSEVSILNSNNKRDVTAASTNVNKPTATVDGISRQIQQRDSALEVVAILQALAAVSCNRTRALWLIEDAKADQLIFRTLLLANGDARTPLCIEMIWNLLQLCPEDTGYFATRDNFEILQNTLRVTVSEGHIAARRELRNDILVVFGLLAEVAPDSQCASGNLVDLVLELACGAELGLTVSSASTVGNNNNNVAGTVVPLNYKQHHTTRAEDMQLKLLGWDLLRRWCVADEDLAELAFSSRFFEALLCYIDVTCENKAVVAWSTSQLLELQEHSLRNLEELVRVGCDFFCTSNGPAICVSYLLECPARPPTLLQCAISLLAEAASSNARKLVAETGAIPLALRLLSSVPLSRETISRHVDCLTLIADLVDRTEVYQNEFYNNRGVEILMPLLLGAVEFADLGDELMLAATDCVWGCILGSNRNEQRFMEVGGVGALLAVLDMRKILGEAHDAKQKTLASSMQKSTRFASQTASTLQNEEDSAIAKQFSQDAANFPLACLADLLMYPGAPESAKKWRSTKTNRSGVQILLSLWKMEQVPTEIIKEGTITAHTASKFDVGCAVLGTASRDPLAVGKGIFENAGEKDRSELSRIIPVSSRDPTFVSRNGIVVPPQDIRNLAFAFRKNLKVFSAISSIGYHGHHELELEERATLTTIQQFVALCKDEVWETVSNSLAEAGVDPTDADWETLRQLREAAEQRACGLQATRAAFSEMHRRQREIAEKTFYEALIKRNEERGLSGTAKGQHQQQDKNNNNTANAVKQSSAANNFIPGLGGANQLSSSTEIPGGGVSGECSIDGADSPPNLSMPHVGAGSVRFAPNMSITEAKMRNKQMLKSSFKHPVRNAGGSQQPSQQQTGFLQLEDVSVDHSHGQFGESKSEYPVDENNNNNNNEIMFSSGHLAAGIEKFAGSVMTKWGVGQRSMNEDEFILFEVINTLRTHPRSLVPIFEAALKRYDADSGSIAPIPDTSDDPIICEEGPKCIREAIEFLKKVRPLSVLLDVPAGLLFAARDFVKTAQDRLDNIAEEESPAATEQRLARYGKVEGKKMQLVALGSNSAESIIVQLVLGDGNPERPERAALFDADFRCCGCTIAEHPVYRHVGYISMTAGYLDKPHHEQKSAHEALWSDI